MKSNKYEQEQVGRLSVISIPLSDEAQYMSRPAVQTAGTVIFIKKKNDKVLGITCQHVIKNAHNLGVKMILDSDDTETPVEIIKQNEDADFALLQMQPTKDVMDRIGTVEWGDSRKLSRMQDMEAEGFTMGWATKDQYGARHGLPLKYSARNTQNNLLQLKGIGLNPGMSGGSITYDGKLVGMVRSRPEGTENIVLATPADHLRVLADDTTFGQPPSRKLKLNLSRNCKDFNEYHQISSLTSKGGVIMNKTSAYDGIDEGDVLLGITDPHTQKMVPVTYSGMAVCEDGLLSIDDIMQQYPLTQGVALSVVTPSDNAKVARQVTIPPPNESNNTAGEGIESFGLFASSVPLAALEPEVAKMMPEEAQEAVLVADVYGGSHFQLSTPVGKGQIITHVGKNADGAPNAVINMEDYQKKLLRPETVNDQEFLTLRTICGKEGCRGLGVAKLSTLMSELPLLQNMNVPLSTIYQHYNERGKLSPDNVHDDVTEEVLLNAPTEADDDFDLGTSNSEVTESIYDNVEMDDEINSLRPPAYKVLELELQ